jgi:hypothetical protein
MAYNPLLPTQGTNKFTFNTGNVPENMLPPGPQGAALKNVQTWGNPDVQGQTNPLSAIPTAGSVFCVESPRCGEPKY